jgi:hypothetical protein
MTITMTPTTQIVVVKGVQCRRWAGVTGKGTTCDVFVPVMRVSRTQDTAEFERELLELPPPLEAIDLRMLI